MTARPNATPARLRVLLLVAALVIAACSVSQPRDGFTTASGETTTPTPNAVADSGTPATSGSATGQREPGRTEDNGPTTDMTENTAPSGASQPTGSAAADSSAETSTDGEPSGPSTRAPADGGTAAPGVTDDSVTVSFVASFTGTYGPVVQQIYEGFAVWVDDVNARGGIHGRHVKVKKVDHQETAAGGVAACKQVLQNGSFFAIIGQGAGDANMTAADCLDKNGYVHSAFVGEPDPTWTHSYYMIPPTSIQGKSLASFVDNRMGDGDKKLGVMYVSAPVYTAALEAYVKAARARGMDVAAVEQIEPNQSTFTSQLLRMRNAGVENIAIIATIEAIGIFRDARALNYKPNFTGIAWLFDFVTQAARDTAKGAQGLRLSATVDSPAFAGFHDKAEEHGRSGIADGEAFLFYGYGLLLEKILTAAGPEPTLQTLQTGIESIRSYDNQILPPITWGPGDYVGAEASYPAECCNPDFSWSSMGPPQRDF